MDEKTLETIADKAEELAELTRPHSAKPRRLPPQNAAGWARVENNACT